MTKMIENQGEIDGKMGELRTLISVLVAASTGRDTFDYEGFSLLLEDKFAELYDTYYQAVGEKRKYERFTTR